METEITELDIYCSTHNLHQISKARLENSFKWILMVNCKIEKTGRSKLSGVTDPVANVSEAHETSPKAPARDNGD